jgi:asparaginyl-tRNA synthetase
MRLQEEFVSYIVGRALERCAEQLKELERDTAPLERVKAPFARISYTDAVAALNRMGSDMQWGHDLGGDDETPWRSSTTARCSSTTIRRA